MTRLLALLLCAAVAGAEPPEVRRSGGGVQDGVPPRMVVVDVDIERRPDRSRGRLLWIGVAPNDADLSWLVPGAAPRVVDVGELMEVEDRWTLVLPVRPDLVYFAAVDVDGDGVVGASEPVGGPVRLGPAARMAVLIDRPLGGSAAPGQRQRPVRPIQIEGRRPAHPGGEPPPPIGEGVQTSLTLALGPRLVSYPEGRVVVVGHAPDAPWERGLLPEPPAFRWTSAPRTLDWPLVLEAPLPAGLQIVVGLDLDGDGVLGARDLVARPLDGPTPGAPLEIVLDRTLPPPPSPERVH